MAVSGYFVAKVVFLLYQQALLHKILSYIMLFLTRVALNTALFQ